jgi:hypothetical protein
MRGYVAGGVPEVPSVTGLPFTLEILSFFIFPPFCEHEKDGMIKLQEIHNSPKGATVRAVRKTQFFRDIKGGKG